MRTVIISARNTKEGRAGPLVEAYLTIMEELRIAREGYARIPSLSSYIQLKVLDYTVAAPPRP